MIHSLKDLCEQFEWLEKEFPDDCLYSHALFVVRFYYLFFVCSYCKREMIPEIFISVEEADLVIDLFSEENIVVTRAFFLKLIFIRLLGQMNKISPSLTVDGVFDAIQHDENTPNLEMNEKINTAYFELIKNTTTEEVETLVKANVPSNSPWFVEIAERVRVKFFS